MPKKKKTRDQKMQSDMRRQNEYMYAPKPSYEITKTALISPISPTPKQNATTHAISTNDYKYLRGDLIKTAALTGSIILIEIVLKIFTKGV